MENLLYLRLGCGRSPLLWYDKVKGIAPKSRFVKVFFQTCLLAMKKCEKFVIDKPVRSML